MHTACTDHRITAVGTVVASNIGEAFRGPGFSPDGASAALDRLGAARTQEVTAGSSTPARVNWLPDTLKGAAAAGIDTIPAITYYRTPRGGSVHSTNRRLNRQ